jgi:thiamine phosphate synthase YjbQ (UPF0047 family)
MAILVMLAKHNLSRGTPAQFTTRLVADSRIQEDEPLLLDDLRDCLSRLAAPDASYGHNDFVDAPNTCIPTSGQTSSECPSLAPLVTATPR